MAAKPRSCPEKKSCRFAIARSLMPRRLLDRWQPESIREFRAAARQRFDDAVACAAAGRRTGAIYLWGDSAELLLKAAYFSVIGLSETASITWSSEIVPAIHTARTTY
jgi:hypothetical protein